MASINNLPLFSFLVMEVSGCSFCSGSIVAISKAELPASSLSLDGGGGCSIFFFFAGLCSCAILASSISIQFTAITSFIFDNKSKLKRSLISTKSDAENGASLVKLL